MVRCVPRFPISAALDSCGLYSLAGVSPFSVFPWFRLPNFLHASDLHIQQNLYGAADITV